MEYPQSNMAMEQILVDGSLLNPEKMQCLLVVEPYPSEKSGNQLGL